MHCEISNDQQYSIRVFSYNYSRLTSMITSISEVPCLLIFVYYLCFFLLVSMYSTIDKHNNEIYIVRLAMISNIVSVSSSYFPINKHNIEIYNIRSAMISNTIYYYCLRNTCDRLLFDVHPCGIMCFLCLIISLYYSSSILSMFT